MKKIVFLLLLHGVVSQAAAQVPDTIYGRCYRYYYNEWYDNCEHYTNCTSEYTDRNWFFATPARHVAMSGMPFDIVAREYTVPGRVAIKGLVALADGFINPEYMMLFQYDTTAPGNTALLDMVRWDTAARKIMKLPQCVATMNQGDPTKFMYIDSYEAYLNKPVVVDSLFYIAGTFKSDTMDRWALPYDTIYSENVHYYTIQQRGSFAYCDTCIHNGHLFYNYFPVTQEWYTGFDGMCGMFIAIVDSDYYQLTVLSDSLAMGTVEGGGHYVSMSRVQISATPEPGYRFAMWSDGSTENPRTVEVYYDTVFTALFTEESNFVVSVEANRPTWGSVTGGGIYAPGQTATIEATAVDDRYRFFRWADGDTTNPRMAVIDRDTLFTAVFASLTGIADVHHDQLEFVISPNPSHDRVTLTTSKDGCYNVSVFDNSGCQVTSAVFVGTQWTLDISRLAAGTYYISLLSAEGEGVKSFVKQ